MMSTPSKTLMTKHTNFQISSASLPCKLFDWFLYRFLGIRTPEKVLDSFTNRQSNFSFHSGDEGEGMLRQQIADPITHSVYKRYIPHKFWARARPHNKFRKKKHKPHGNSVKQGIMNGEINVKNK